MKRLRFSRGCLRDRNQENAQSLAACAGYDFCTLIDRAGNGDREAAKELHKTLAGVLSEFTELCRAEPELFEPVARKCGDWPGFITRDADVRKSNADIITELGLGRGAELNYTGKQWSRETPETLVALQLYVLLRAEREHYAWLSKKLPPLSRPSAGKWFAAAWPRFIEQYGQDFENRKRFAHHWRNLVFKEDKPGCPGEKQLKPKARALIRDHIRKKIKQGFRSIAAKSDK
jgi:hypothetical protein